MQLLCPKVHANVRARAKIPVQIRKSNHFYCLLTQEFAICVYFNFCPCAYFSIGKFWPPFGELRHLDHSHVLQGTTFGKHLD